MEDEYPGQSSERFGTSTLKKELRRFFPPIKILKLGLSEFTILNIAI